MTAFGLAGTTGAMTTTLESACDVVPSSFVKLQEAVTVTIVLEATSSPFTSAVREYSSPVAVPPSSEHVHTAFVTFSMREPLESSAMSV